MKISVSEIEPSKQLYPFSHRLQFSGDNDNLEQVSAWVNKNNIECYLIPYREISGWHQTVAVYINEPELTAFLLRWS